MLKLAKGLLLFGVGLGVFRLINADLADLVRRLTLELRIDPENRYVQILLEKAANVDPRQLRNVGLLSLLFSADLIAEGIGLWLDKAWAKYLVLFATGLFIPFEALACLRRSDWQHWLLLAVNLAVVAYIAHLLWSRRRSRREDA